MSSTTGDRAQEDVPCFDEMLRTPRLFFMFLSFLVDQLASENLFFLQAVRLYRLLQRPQPELDALGRTIISAFCVAGSPSEVNISAETRQTLFQVLMRAPKSESESEDTEDAEALTTSLFTPTVFDVAYGEIRGLLSQPYGAWLATGEWRQPAARSSIRWKRPPSFATVVREPALRAAFGAFLADANNGATPEDVAAFQFCVDAETFREHARQVSAPSTATVAVSAAPPTPSGHRKKAHAHKRSSSISNSVLAAAASVPVCAESGEQRCHSDNEEDEGDAVEGGGANDREGRKTEKKKKGSQRSELEKMARAICKRHGLPKRPKDVSYRLHLSAQQDRATAQWAKHALFAQWIASRAWADVPYRESEYGDDDTLSLSRGQHGRKLREAPTLAATLVSLCDEPAESSDGVGALFRFLMAYTAYPRDLDFMVAALRFHEQFSAPAADRDAMVAAARDIFDTFLAPARDSASTPAEPSPCPAFLHRAPSPLCSSSSSSPSSSSPSPPLPPSPGTPHEPASAQPPVLLDTVLVNEVRGVLWSSARARVHAEMYRRAAAFVYQRAAATWFRELQAGLCWADRVYDNSSVRALTVAAHLGDRAVVADVWRPGAAPVLCDDIVADASLYARFAAHVGAARRPAFDALDRISAFRMRRAQPLAAAQSLRASLKRAAADNLVVRKLLKAAKAPAAAAVAHAGGAEHVRVSGAAFDFVRDALLRQLLADGAERFLASRPPAPAVRATHIRFFRYVEPLHAIELAVTTKCSLVGGGAVPAPVSLSVGTPTTTTISSSTGCSTPATCTPGDQSGSSMMAHHRPRAGGNLTVAVPRGSGADSSGGESDDTAPSPTARARRPGLLGFLRKPRHAPLLRLRTPSSDAPPARTALSDPPSPIAPHAALQQQQGQQGQQGLSASAGAATAGAGTGSSSAPLSPGAVALTVPSLDEVLGSAYFRQLITDYYFGRVDEDEANAWDDLTDYHAKFSKLDDAALRRAQGAALRFARSVVDGNRAFLGAHAAALEQRLDAARPDAAIAVTANFFRDVERALFADAYDAFAHHLVQCGWKALPIAAASDDELMFI